MDSDKKESFVGKAASGDVQSEGIKLVKDSFGDQMELRNDPRVIDKNQADKLAKDILIRNAREYVTGTGASEGNIDLRAGGVIKIEGIAEKFKTTYFILSTKHVLDTAGGYTTWFEVISDIGTDTKNASSTAANKGDSYNEPGQKGAAAGSAAGAKTEEEEKEKNPEITNLKWKDKDKKDISKALVDDEVFMTADVKDIDDGVWLKMKLYEKDYVGENDFIKEDSVIVKQGKIEYKWTVEYHEDTDDINSAEEQEEKGYTLPEYIFTLV